MKIYPRINIKKMKNDRVKKEYGKEVCKWAEEEKRRKRGAWKKYGTSSKIRLLN